MQSDSTITLWIEDLKRGDEQAAHELWNRFSPRVVGLARRQLGGIQRRAADEEDVAQTAFVSFWNDACSGHFPEVRNREELWQLLRVITKRKVLDHIKHECRKKRGGGAVRGESALMSNNNDERSGLDQYEGVDHAPDQLAVARELWDRLIARLPTDELRQIAELKRDGYSNDEIAEHLGCSQSTVFRRLASIRRAWEIDRLAADAA